jgi:hypothetical protein
VLLTDQTGLTHWLDRPSAAAPQSSVLDLWINQGTKWFCDEPLETPRTWGGLPLISTHELAPVSSRLNLDFEAQPRKCTRLRHAVLATMRSALDPIGHQVPQTNSICPLHT